jgi:hypothetical protein
MSEGLIKKTYVVVPAELKLSLCLPSAECEELDQLPLDHPNMIVEDDKLFRGINLGFYFRRKYPLMRYSATRKESQKKVATQMTNSSDKDPVKEPDEDKTSVSDKAQTTEHPACSSAEVESEKGKTPDSNKAVSQSCTSTEESERNETLKAQTTEPQTSIEESDKDKTKTSDSDKARITEPQTCTPAKIEPDRDKSSNSDKAKTTDPQTCTSAKGDQSSILLQIKPQNSPSVLLTGDATVTRISNIDGIKGLHSVFMVPHYEEKDECLSLLPSDVRKLLSPEWMEKAALHITLYLRRKSFGPDIENLDDKLELKERAKSFHYYYLHSCNPESDLMKILQTPNPNLSHASYSGHSQVSWYEEHLSVFSQSVVRAVSEEQKRQQERLAFLRGCLAWAHFYRLIHARVYVLSSEALEQDPCLLEVLNGILIANAAWGEEGNTCCVLLTGNFPYSLDDAIQRDVRKLVYPPTSDCSQPSVRVGYLGNVHHFFTINPWSDLQTHDLRGPHRTVSVSTSSVTGLGTEPHLNLIRDDLDIRALCSTTTSNKLADCIACSQMPGSTKSSKSKLEPYLKEIGYNEPCRSVHAVLSCLIGPPLVAQLENLSSLDVPELVQIIPALLKHKICGNLTEFNLSATKSSASSATIEVRKPSLKVGDVTVRSARFIVKKAKTMLVEITLKVAVVGRSNEMPFAISKYLNLKGSCGKTVADYIYSICCNEEAWLSAKKPLTMGEVLQIILQEDKALAVIKSFPLFLSFPLAKCKINHHLTTVLMESSRKLKEAHIHISDPTELSPIFIGCLKLHITVHFLVLHLFPSYDTDERMIEVEGKCTVNEMPMRLTSESSPSGKKHMNLFFDKTLLASEAFRFFKVDVPPIPLSISVEGCDLGEALEYAGGCTISQELEGTEEAQLSVLFFEVSVNLRNIQSLLPPALCPLIKEITVKTTVHFPGTSSPKFGLEASFISEVDSLESGNVTLDCLLSVCPSLKGEGYTYEVSMKPHNRPHKQQQLLGGASLYSIVSALGGAMGKGVATEVGKIPHLGDQILCNTVLKEMVLKLSNRQVQAITLDIYATELGIIHGKFSANNCIIKLTYCSGGDLTIECSGTLVFLKEHNYSVEMSLPTATKKGKICFNSHDKDLMLKTVLQEFDWLSHEAATNPILAKLLDVTVRKVLFEYHFLPKSCKPQITEAVVSVFKDQLDINLVAFNNINLDVTVQLVNDQYHIVFSLDTSISDTLYVQLKYSSDYRILKGRVRVQFAKSLVATTSMETFNSPLDTYDDLKTILCKDFMRVFQSDLNIQETKSGSTTLLDVSIQLPSKWHSKQYALKHLKLAVEDALKIHGSRSSYILHTFQFEFLGMPSEDIASTSHLTLALHKLNSKESMLLNFDFTSRCKSQDSSLFTAKLEEGPQGGFLKLSSAIDIARTASPDLPKFETGLPPIFDISLVSGLVSFTISPFKPCAFEVHILIDEWRVFADPELTVHKLKTNWKSGSYPELTFTDCSLVFLEHELLLSGKLAADEVLIECRGSKQLGKKPTEFRAILGSYSPKSQPQPDIPEDIGLPSMEVELTELFIHLQKKEKTIRLNTRVLAHAPWVIDFGGKTISVHELGGALEWKGLEGGKTEYKAFLYGFSELLGVHVEIEMLLERDIDSIISATITKPEQLHYGQIADNLLSASQEVVPSSPEESSLSELVPESLQELHLSSAVIVALNVSKKQFFLSSEVRSWGTGSLLVGYLLDDKDMDYIISLTLHDNFRFGRLCDYLAFIDDLIVLRNPNLLISSVTLEKSLLLTNQFDHSFSQSHMKERLKEPFYESKIMNSPKLVEQPIREGVTVYAEIDLRRSEGVLSKVLEIGDGSLEKEDITVMVYLGKDFQTIKKTNLEVHAWISRILLFEMLEFSDIHVLYKVEEASTFEMSGTVAIGVDLKADKPVLKFVGCLSVTPTEAHFLTKWCADSVDKPAGMRAVVHKLELELRRELKKGGTTDVRILGRLEIANIPLTCKFLIQGSSFKVFAIELGCNLKLMALFTCNEVGSQWSVNIPIGIKEGKFHYATSDVDFREDGEIIHYKVGYHLQAVISFLGADFAIGADIPLDRSSISLFGRSVSKIPLGFAELTGKKPHDQEGPELRYCSSTRTLSLSAGVEILQQPWFEGELIYKSAEKAVEGEITYLGQFLWLKNPSMLVRWSQSGGFEILEFQLLGGVPFSLLKAIKVFAKVLFSLITGLFSYEIKLHLRTGKNPDRSLYMLVLILTGELAVNIAGVMSVPFFPLPEIPLLLRKVDNLSFKTLPKYILSCLWDSARAICLSLLNYLNPWELAKRMGKMYTNTVKGVITTIAKVREAVIEGVKKVDKKILSCFGFSAFIIDSEEGMVLGYICGGRGGKKLHDEHFVVTKFGPFLAINAVGAMVSDVHRCYRACVAAKSEENDVISPSSAENEHTERSEEDLKSLDELQERTRALRCSLDVMADELLTVKDICVSLQSSGILIEWSVCNGELEVYSGDSGDIEHHISVTATVIKDTNVEVKTLYSDIFTNIVSVPETEEGTASNEEGKSGEETAGSQFQAIKGISGGDAKKEGQDMSATTAGEGVTVSNKGKGEERVLKVDEKIHDDEVSGKKYEEVKEEKSADCMSAEVFHNNTRPEDDHEGEQYVKHEIKQEDELPQEENHEESTLPNGVMSLSIDHIDQETLEHSVCICVSVQPEVTLKIMTLPPDKIGKSEYAVHTENLELQEGDMKKIKKEIKENGRIKEVTLHGKKVCEQKLIKPCSESEVKFTACCNHTSDCFVVYGTIEESVPEADCYLVRLVDKMDKTILVKQQQMPSDQLDFRFEVFPKDLPDTSTGPYLISIIALTADLSACSIFTPSQLEISRFPTPENLTLTLPDPESHKPDTVKLRWELSSRSEVSVSGQQELNSLSRGAEFTVTISGISIKEKNDGDTSIHKIGVSEQEVIHISKSVQAHQDLMLNKQPLEYEFSLIHAHKQQKRCVSERESAILFRCHVATKGNSKLPSMPKPFMEFILLTPPAELKVEVPESEAAGLQVSWAYSMHTMTYRIELVEEESKEVVCSKVCKSGIGSRGDDLLDYDDLRDVPGSGESHYQLQMYSLGFGQDLVRCLEPSVATGKFHVITSKLLYLENSSTIQVKYKPPSPQPGTNAVTLTAQLFHIQGTKKISLCVTTRHVHRIGATEIVENFQLKKWIPMNNFQSGDVVRAWVCSSSQSSSAPLYCIGIPKEELCFMEAPKLQVSFSYEHTWTVSRVELSWSKIAMAKGYKYGCYLPEGRDHLTIKTTHETHVILNHDHSLPNLLGNCQFRYFVSAFGSPGALLTGEVSLNVNIFQCIHWQSQGEDQSVVFTSISLQKVWNRHLISFVCSHLFLLAPKTQYMLHPSFEPFPKLTNLSQKFQQKFWETEFQYEAGKSV